MDTHVQTWLAVEARAVSLVQVQGDKLNSFDGSISDGQLGQKPFPRPVLVVVADNRREALVGHLEIREGHIRLHRSCLQRVIFLHRNTGPCVLMSQKKNGMSSPLVMVLIPQKRSKPITIHFTKVGFATRRIRTPMKDPPMIPTMEGTTIIGMTDPEFM